MSSKKKSKLWKHFSVSDCKKKATCNLCYTSLSYSMASSSNLRRHLKSKHSEIELGAEEPVEIYTVEEVASEGMKTYEITMKSFDEMDQDPSLAQPPDSDWKAESSEEWRVDELVSTKEKKDRKRSVVWEHFNKSECKTSAMCRHCRKMIRLGTVSNLLRHLRNKHRDISFTLHRTSIAKEDDNGKHDDQDVLMVAPNNKEGICSEVYEISVDDLQNPVNIIETRADESSFLHLEYQNGEINEPRVTQSSQTEFLEDIDEFDINDYIRPNKTAILPKQVDEQLIKMVVKGCHSFHVVKQPEFEDFVKLLNPRYRIPSVNDISQKLIPEYYRNVERRTSLSLQKAEGVCLYLDQWRMRSSVYLCMTAHFVNSDCKFESLFLSCNVISETESATNISERLIQIVDVWGIAEKIVAVVTDNCEKLNTAVQECKWRLVPNFLQTLAFIINESLVIINPLLRKVTALLQELTDSPETVASIYARQKALNLQPVKLLKKKIHNASSTFLTVEMLSRLVKLKTSICHVQQDTNGIKLLEQEWKILSRLVEFFGIFKAIKNEFSVQGQIIFSKVVFYIKAIKREINKFKSSPTNPSEVVLAITAADTAFNAQFKELENVDFISNLLLLDPRLKRHVFEDESESVSACSVLKKEVCDMVIPDLSFQEVEPDPNSFWFSFDNEVKKLNAVKDPIGKGILELENYLQEQLLGRNEDPLLWWKERQAVYPRMFKLAKKYLCVIAKSVIRESISYKSAYMLSQLKSCNLTSLNSEVMFLHHNM